MKSLLQYLALIIIVLQFESSTFADPPVSKEVINTATSESGNGEFNSTSRLPISDIQANLRIQPVDIPIDNIGTSLVTEESIDFSNGSLIAKKLSDQDPAFNQYLDFNLLESLNENPKAGTMVDIALMLAEGERILLRQHKYGITAEDLLVSASSLANKQSDTQTLIRLNKAAEKLKSEKLKNALNQIEEFGSSSRASSPSVSIEDVDLETLELLDSIRRASESASISGSDTQLKELKERVNSSIKNNQVKKYLLEKIESSLKDILGREKSSTTDEVLAEFASESRGWVQNISGGRITTPDPIRKIAPNGISYTPPQESGSYLAVTGGATIHNRTKIAIAYSINGRRQNQRLSPGHSRYHTIYTNSGGPNSIRISYDNGRGSTKSHNIYENNYNFRMTNNGLLLFNN